MAAPQGPCPLPSGARLEGIESRDDAPPRRMVMRHGGGVRSAGAAVWAQNAVRAHAGTKAHATHSAVNMILLQSQKRRKPA